MSIILRGLVLLATAGALSLPQQQLPLTANDASNPNSGRRRGVSTTPAPATPTHLAFAPNQVEYYLNDDGLAYIRPGVKITNVTITNVGPSKKPVVEFYLTDNFNQPLDRKGEVTPGTIAPGFVLSSWDATTRYYTTYTMRTRNGVTNPAGDSTGSYEDIAIGHYKYTFSQAMPASLDVTKTFTLGIYARRTLTTIIGKDYYADNVFVDFRPDGLVAPTAVWAAMDTEKTCNSCHDPLGLHGGTRRSVKLCMQCHNTQVQTDSTSGESFDGKRYFHKIHMGENLPSVEAGGTYYAGGDFSTVALPQDIRNCTSCHDATAAEKEIWYTRPSRLACGSCHDDVNFATGDNHPGGAQADDSACATCHIPDSGQEFDASVKGAHTIPLKSKQLKGIVAKIVSVSNMAPGKKPTVVFDIKMGGVATDGSKLSTFSPIFAGPATSYKNPYFRESGVPSSTNTNVGVFDAATGYTTFTFNNAVPADATGTWTVSADIYKTTSLVRADGGDPISVRDAALNPVKYVNVTGGDAVARRTSVVMTNCNACHNALALHGDQRKNIDECVMCHNPDEGDQSRRPATAGAKESVSFQRMIHRIHTGEELTQDFTVYGFGGSVNNFNEVLYPGDRRNCLGCHVNAASYSLPVPEKTAGNVTTLRDYFSPQGPGTAACLGCHDNRDAAAHAYLNTTTFGGTDPAEACATCHGAGAEWSADKVHAR